MTFSADISKWVAKANGNTTKIVRKIVIDLGTKIIIRTPVGNPDLWQSPPPPGYAGGRARANWQYGSGDMPRGALDVIDANGNLTINKLTAGVRNAPTASIHWLANNLPYIERLETGWSTQAPNGMVRLAVTEFEQVVREAAKGVS